MVSNKQAAFSSDEVAPSVGSPTLMRFAVEDDLRLPWLGSSAPGLVTLGPMDSTFGPQKGVGPSCVGTPVEATECLLASPRSTLCSFPDEATDLPASPRTLPPSSPIPDFALLVTPPLRSQSSVKPLLVYSRRRFHHPKIPMGENAAAAAVPLVAAAAQPLASTQADMEGPPSAAATVLPQAAATVPPPEAAQPLAST